MVKIKYTQKGIIFGFIPVAISDSEDGYTNIKTIGIFYNCSLWLLSQGFYVAQFVHSLLTSRKELQMPLTIYK